MPAKNRLLDISFHFSDNAGPSLLVVIALDFAVAFTIDGIRVHVQTLNFRLGVGGCDGLVELVASQVAESLAHILRWEDSSLILPYMEDLMGEHSCHGGVGEMAQHFDVESSARHFCATQYVAGCLHEPLQIFQPHHLQMEAGYFAQPDAEIMLADEFDDVLGVGQAGAVVLAVGAEVFARRDFHGGVMAEPSAADASAALMRSANLPAIQVFVVDSDERFSADVACPLLKEIALPYLLADVFKQSLSTVEELVEHAFLILAVHKLIVRDVLLL